MSITFLSHKPITGLCGGQIIIDAGQSIKLFAPSFSINPTGVSRLTFDTKVEGDGRILPVWGCMKCGEIIKQENIGEELVATCQICGKEKQVKDLLSHTHIVCVCTKCINDMKEYAKTGEHKNSRIKEFTQMFNITKSTRGTPMITVLTQPIQL